MKGFSRYSIGLPVVIGLAVFFAIFYKEYDSSLFRGLTVDAKMIAGVVLAVILILMRDAGLMLRFRQMSAYALSWRQVFNVNVLCEFTSAVTPSSVGGSSLIVLFLKKEGIEMGRASAIMVACLFLDELFLVLLCPLILLFFSADELFGASNLFSSSIKLLFIATYSVVFLWTVVLFVALFKRPNYVKSLLQLIAKLPVLRRWKDKIEVFATDLALSSGELSNQSMRFWFKAMGSTCLAWICRFAVVNALLFAFSEQNGHLLAFARQLILWIVMTVAPTPGGSGVSEYMFKEYYESFFPIAGVALIVAFVWRIITYYLYLLLGFLVIPSWITKSKDKEE